MTRRIVLASSNAGKLREFRRLLAGLDFDVIAQGELGIEAADEPHPDLHRERPRQGASCRRMQRPAGAGRRLGSVCRSAGRRAGRPFGALCRPDGADDAANNAELLRRLQKQSRSPRPLHLRAGGGGLRATIRSRSSPTRAGTARSCTSRAASGGFGYDPLVLLSPNAAAPQPNSSVGGKEPHQPPRPGACAIWCGGSPPGDEASVETDERDSDRTCRRPVPRRRMSRPSCGRERFHCRHCRRCRCTFIIRGAYASAPIATSTRTNRKVASGRIPEADYLATLRSDIEAALPLIWGRRIVSVFIGGGTPSLLSARGLDTLLSDVRALLAAGSRLRRSRSKPIPGTVEADRFADYRAAGVNRLSIGIQSFDDANLHALGRIHDRAQALRAIDIGAAGVRQLQPRSDVRTAAAKTSQTRRTTSSRPSRSLPPHLSLYQLTLEPNTVFAKHPPRVAGRGHRRLDAGMDRGSHGRGRLSPLRGLGLRAARAASAATTSTTGDSATTSVSVPVRHSKISFPHRIIRQVRFRQPRSYLERGGRGEFLVESSEVARDDLPFEFMLNAMRLTEGVPSRWFVERTGLPPTAIERARCERRTRGLMAIDHSRWAPTPLGARFLNDLAGALSARRSCKRTQSSAAVH